MKKTIFFVVAIMMMAATAMAQGPKLAFPAEWEQYGRSNFQYVRSYAVDPATNGGDNMVDVYKYLPTDSQYTVKGYCPTCTNTQQQPVNVNNDVNVVTYDREIELMKAQYQAALLELEQLKLQNQQVYQAELLKMQKRQGRWAGFTSFLNSAGSVLTGSGTVMQGKAALDGKYGTNVYTNTNVYGTTTNQPQGGPWTGSTTTIPNTTTNQPQGGPWTGGTTIPETDPRWNGGTVITTVPTTIPTTIPNTNQPQGGPWTGNTGGYRPVIQGWGPPQ